ncbi:hypothetical protein SELMODRAFT_420698 [Selaginella moellendorffii]|uniref:Uncharacterized protein n=1 Tax=Selaginella moellendorffii TaxID=88036 RepID=D8SCU3_SELML|nr:hypothetical protein SELMODRAFT_420698 [Selaginella moellendorffii]
MRTVPEFRREFYSIEIPSEALLYEGMLDAIVSSSAPVKSHFKKEDNTDFRYHTFVFYDRSAEGNVVCIMHVCALGDHNDKDYQDALGGLMYAMQDRVFEMHPTRKFALGAVATWGEFEIFKFVAGSLFPVESTVHLLNVWKRNKVGGGFRALMALMCAGEEAMGMEPSKTFYDRGEYESALDRYTRTIAQTNLEQEKSVLLSNGAPVHLRMANYRHAFEDARRGLRSNSSNAKAMFRGAKAALELEKLREGLSLCDQAIEKAPKDASLRALKNENETKMRS